MEFSIKLSTESLPAPLANWAKAVGALQMAISAIVAGVPRKYIDLQGLQDDIDEARVVCEKLGQLTPTAHADTGGPSALEGP
jgi:hypothetical protein